MFRLLLTLIYQVQNAKYVGEILHVKRDDVKFIFSENHVFF